MTDEKRSASYTLRVLMSEKERKELEKLCQLDGGATMSNVVRRALEFYGIQVHKNYTKRLQAIKSAERAYNAVEPIDEARKRIEAYKQAQAEAGATRG
jgi:hypothetical protein